MKIQISGEIVDKHYDGCFCPQDLKDALSGVDENEPLEVEITSEGGSVFAGIQIANTLARWKGNVTTHAVGFVASIATVILMAGKKVVADENCFCLIHNPWTFVQGNANDLQKEIQNLEKCKEAMMGFYRKHSKISDEDLSNYLDAETWFTGSELANVFDVEVLPNDEMLDIAAKYDLTKYKTLPRGLTMTNEEKKEMTTEEEKVEKTTEQPIVEEEKKEEVKEEVEEEKSEEPDPDDIEELRKTIEILKQENEQLKAKLAECEKQKAELEEEKKEEVTEEEVKEEEKPETTEEVKKEEEEVVTKAQVQKRISGIQASMQKQINDFKSQLKAKEEELMKAKAEVTRLSDSLEQAAKELSQTASILDEKTQALEKLNANVNALAEEVPTMNDGLAKCATPAEKVAFIKSGKYVR